MLNNPDVTIIVALRRQFRAFVEGPLIADAQVMRPILTWRRRRASAQQEKLILSKLGDFVEDQDQELPGDTTIRHNLRQIASGHLADFRRGFGGLELARDLIARGEPHWFLDLLALWRPSGEPSGDVGLRLAVRNGYLNFYRLGQSIARVSVARGEFRGDLHVKYFSKEARSSASQAYGRFKGNRVVGAGYDEPYLGVTTLGEWAAVIGEHYSGTEKELVDELVHRNSNVIDLEMALPAWASQRTAPRMDLVVIENHQVVFWEAKTVADGRIRCRSDVVQDRFPEVLEQMAKYRAFLQQDLHVERVAAAYQAAAKVLVDLRALADLVGPKRELGPEIVAASQSTGLSVAREAALVVLDDKPPTSAKWRSWHDNGHAAKLQGHVKTLVQSAPGRLVLGDAS